MTQSKYFAENAASRNELQNLIQSLDEAALRRPMEAGWTVSSVLAHLAFWDQRGLLLIEKWEKEGVGPSPLDIDLVNEATRGFFLAIPPRTAVEITLAYAAAMDQKIEQLSPEMIAAIETSGKTVRLDRAHHRRMHVEEIKQLLGI